MSAWTYSLWRHLPTWGTSSSGAVKIESDFKRPIAGKHILIVEDIVDTGTTLQKVLNYFKQQQVASVKLASLLWKPARNIHPTTIDYLGFEIEDEFVIGYGMDYDGFYRELPDIGIYRNEES